MLTKKQKELLSEFADSMRADGKHHSPRESTWLDGVKKFIDGITG